MRFCDNETVEVYETEGKNLATVLRDVAVTVDNTEASWHNLTVAFATDDEGWPVYRATLYVH